MKHVKTNYFLLVMSITLITFCCANNDEFNNNNGGGSGAIIANGCPGYGYPNWATSPHKLPYPVGQSYSIGLSHCSGGEHSAGMPDQFAIDIIMDVGTLVTAARRGYIIYVEESGLDFEAKNNVVVIRDEDDYFIQYQHLTHNGAIVEEGQFVEVGDPIGYSGASGNARTPHLHFVATDWDFLNPYGTNPYQSFNITFSNTRENLRSLIQNETYEALPY
jgi:hypothetical protein